LRRHGLIRRDFAFGQNSEFLHLLDLAGIALRIEAADIRRTRIGVTSGD